MKTPQILTGQQAIKQFGMDTLIECRVAVTTELNGLGHSVMQIGVIADPNSCQIDEDDTGVLWVEYQGVDDWYLYSIPADEQFVLLDGKNPPTANDVLARRVVELSSTVDSLAKELAAKPSDSGYAKLQAERDQLAAQVEQLRKTIINATNAGVVTDTGRWIYSIDTSVLDSTPALCLAEVKAQAVNNFVNWACGECETENEEWLCLKEIEYANQIRQQAEGE